MGAIISGRNNIKYITLTQDLNFILNKIFKIKITRENIIMSLYQEDMRNKLKISEFIIKYPKLTSKNK